MEMWLNSNPVESRLPQIPILIATQGVWSKANITKLHGLCVLFFFCRVGIVISTGGKGFLRLTRDNACNEFKFSTGPETDHYSIQPNN